VNRPVCSALAVAAFWLAASAAPAQVVDTVRTVDSHTASLGRRPPLSPRRAFLGSLVLPGYSQSLLGRHRSGAMLLAFEAASFIMIRESALDVREARRNANDSVLVAYVDASGAAAPRYERTAFPRALIKVRKQHVEDWVAVLVANHLFAAADAFVAALLWDLPSEVAVRGTRRSAGVSLGFRW